MSETTIASCASVVTTALVLHTNQLMHSLPILFIRSDLDFVGINII
jgi:hypothetical protein